MRRSVALLHEESDMPGPARPETTPGRPFCAAARARTAHFRGAAPRIWARRNRHRYHLSCSAVKPRRHCGPYIVGRMAYGPLGRGAVTSAQAVGFSPASQGGESPVHIKTHQGRGLACLEELSDARAHLGKPHLLHEGLAVMAIAAIRAARSMLLVVDDWHPATLAARPLGNPLLFQCRHQGLESHPHFPIQTLAPDRPPPRVTAPGFLGPGTRPLG